MSLSLDTKYIRLISSRLRNFKQKSSGLYNFSCPFCGDSKKTLTKARGFAFEKHGGLFVKCHNCGVSTNLGNLVKQVDASLHKEYVLERYTSGVTNNGKTANAILQITSPRFDRMETKKYFDHAEWVSNLPEGHFCLNYVRGRMIPKKHHSRLLFTAHYKQFIDALVPDHGKQLMDDARLVIPFYDDNNELVAVSGRALEGGDKSLRYVTVRTNDSQAKLIYGSERIDKTKTVLIVEGPIDSLFLDNCIASGDANLAATAKTLISIGVPKENIILVPDREPRNKEIVRIVNNFVEEDFRVCLLPNTIEGKDVNEYIMEDGFSASEIQETILNHTFNGMKLRMEYYLWKKV